MKLFEMENIVSSQYATMENHENAVTELESKLSSALSENQALVDQIIGHQNRIEQLESALQARHNETEGLQKIVLDLGRQNQTLQVGVPLHSPFPF